MSTTAITPLTSGARDTAVDALPAASETSLRRLGRVAAPAHTPLLHKTALRHLAPAEQAAAVASQFEAIFVRQLLGETTSSLFGSGGGAAGQVYGDLLADTLSRQLTTGPGLGLGRMLERQLTPRFASEAAADSSSQPSNQIHE